MNNSIDVTLYRFRGQPDYHWLLWGVRHLTTMPVLWLVWSVAAEMTLGDELASTAYYLWPIAINLVVALFSIGVGTWGLHVYFRLWAASVPFSTVLRQALAMVRKDFFDPGASTRG